MLTIRTSKNHSKYFTQIVRRGKLTPALSLSAVHKVKAYIYTNALTSKQVSSIFRFDSTRVYSILFIKYTQTRMPAHRIASTTETRRLRIQSSDVVLSLRT